VAVKQPDGRVYLQEVYLGQDKQGDGWGPLKGHTTWSDWMMEANVGKGAPWPAVRAAGSGAPGSDARGVAAPGPPNRPRPAPPDR